MNNFWWIRHAPVIGNNDCCYGSNEVDCDVSDNKKFKELAQKLPNNGIVFSSPLSRAVKTFEAVLANGFNIKDYRLDERLTEQNLGNWTGLKYSELEKLTKKLNVACEFWLMNAEYIPPNGESFIDLTSRVRNFIKDINAEFTSENIIIFSHGGPIRAALSVAIEFNIKKVLPVNIDNSSLTIIKYENNFWRIEKVNY